MLDVSENQKAEFTRRPVRRSTNKPSMNNGELCLLGFHEGGSINKSSPNRRVLGLLSIYVGGSIRNPSANLSSEALVYSSKSEGRSRTK